MSPEYDAGDPVVEVARETVSDAGYWVSALSGNSTSFHVPHPSGDESDPMPLCMTSHTARWTAKPPSVVPEGWEDRICGRCLEYLSRRGGTGDGYRSSAKLTTDDVVEIRERFRDDPDATMVGVADEYDVVPSTIRCVVDGVNWPNVPGPIRGSDYEPTGGDARAE